MEAVTKPLAEHLRRLDLAIVCLYGCSSYPGFLILRKKLKPERVNFDSIALNYLFFSFVVSWLDLSDQFMLQ